MSLNGLLCTLGTKKYLLDIMDQLEGLLLTQLLNILDIWGGVRYQYWFKGCKVSLTPNFRLVNQSLKNLDIGGGEGEPIS